MQTKRNQPSPFVRVPKRGFTIIELLAVIVVISILGALVIPIYFDIRQETRLANEMGISGGVKRGIAHFFLDPAQGDRGVSPPSPNSDASGYPIKLSSCLSPAFTECNDACRCFDNVMDQGGITDGTWQIRAVGATEEYRSPVSSTNQWDYTPATGLFQKTVA